MLTVQCNACQEKVCFHKLRDSLAEYFQQYGLNMKIFDRNKGFRIGILELNQVETGHEMRNESDQYSWVVGGLSTPGLDTDI